MCKHSEWGREQGDESTRHDIKDYPTQLQTETQRCTNGPQAFDRGGGNKWEIERSSIYVCCLFLISHRSEKVCGSSEPRPLNEVCGFLREGVALMWFLWVCVFVFLSVVCQPFLCLCVSIYLWRHTASKPDDILMSNCKTVCKCMNAFLVKPNGKHFEYLEVEVCAWFVCVEFQIFKPIFHFFDKEPCKKNLQHILKK